MVNLEHVINVIITHVACKGNVYQLCGLSVCHLDNHYLGKLLSAVVFFQAEDGIRDLVRSRGLGDVYKRQSQYC